jgi:hypothetical protein
MNDCARKKSFSLDRPGRGRKKERNPFLNERIPLGLAPLCPGTVQSAFAESSCGLQPRNASLFQSKDEPETSEGQANLGRLVSVLIGSC